MTFIDTHAHIYAKEFNDDIEETLIRTHEAGVSKIVMPNINSESIEPMMAIEERDGSIYFSTMGLHPCYVNDDFEKELKIVDSWFKQRDFVALGEIGIDLYWDKTFFRQQQKVFRYQCELAKELNVPIIIHARDSLDEIFEIMDDLHNDNLKGVFHCFSGSLDQAKKVLDYGFYLGIGGVSTFKNGGLDKVLPHIELDKILLETDAPYLAPVPYRGKRNEPSYVPLIAQRVSDLKEMTIELVAHTTSQNAMDLFKF